MPDLVKPITLRPVQGMVTKDPAHEIPDGASPDMLNFAVYQGVLKKRPGTAIYRSTPFPGSQLTGIYSTQDTSGNTRMFATTANALWRYNTSTNGWDQMTGPALTGSASNLFSFETSQNGLVFSQGVDNIMLLPLTATVYAALSASSFPSKFLTRWNTRLYAASTVEGGNAAPFRVRWSAGLDHTDWTSIGAGFTDLQDDVYQVRNIQKLMNALAVYTEKGIWLGTKTNSAIGPAQFDLVVKDIGLLSPHTLKGYNVQQFIVGTDNFYVFNGIQATPILDAVQQYVFTRLNASKLMQNFAALSYDTQEYLAFLCMGTADTPDTTWVYNWSNGAAYPWQFTAQMPTCITLHRLDNSPTFAQLIGTFAQQNWAFNQGFLSATYPALIFGAVDGQTYQLSAAFNSDNGEAINAYWTSRDLIAEDIDPSYKNYMVTLRGVGVTYIDPGTPFTLQFYYSNNGGGTWTGPFPLTCGGDASGATGDKLITEQVTGKRVRFKIVNNTNDETPQIVAFTPILERKGQFNA